MIKVSVEENAERPVMPDQEALPSLTEAQIGQAVTVIPANYWDLKCWT